MTASRSHKEFDDFAGAYGSLLDESIDCSGEDAAYFSEYKIHDLHWEMVSMGIDPSSGLRLLDFGCGIGMSIPYLHKYFQGAELFGVDVSEESLRYARELHGGFARYYAVVDGCLPNQIPVLDAVCAMCVFHHIDERLHVELLSMIRKRLKRTGVLMVYEHNPLNPLTRRIVDTCPFDANAKLISASVLAERCKQAGFTDVSVKYRVFVPGQLKAFRFLERFLKWCPLGGQYYVKCVA